MAHALAADQLEQIFDLFHQVNPSPTARGLGIGLTVVRELVEQQGGQVSPASDAVGCGSAFTLRLPLAEQARG